jgi:hypothetical protein
MQKILPLPDKAKRKASQLSPWQDGDTKPQEEGLYLREFDEGEAVSEYRHGEWLRDGFFPSDVQDVRWRGLAMPVDKRQKALFK